MDLAPLAVTQFPEWPSLSVLQIQDKSGFTIQRFPDSNRGPAVLHTIMKDGDHYQALIEKADGAKHPENVPANGDCFFQSLELV